MKYICVFGIRKCNYGKTNKRPTYLLISGIICLIIGLIIMVVAPDPTAANVEIAKNATNAVQAAQQISHNNQTYIWIHTLSQFLLGYGIAATIGGFLAKKFVKK